jgi:ankyrin repeat protein
MTPLSLIAGNGHETVVKWLLTTEVVEPDSKDNRYRTPLSWTARNGHEAEVKLLITVVGVDWDSKNIEG